MSTTFFTNFFIALVYTSFQYSIQVSQRNTNLTDEVCEIL